MQESYPQMTMTASPSTSNRDISNENSPSQVNANIQATTPQSIRAIQLADGWHSVENCQLVQFAIGESHSPITPSKLYTYLSYQSEGRTVYTPISSVIGFDIMSSQSSSQGKSK